MRTTVNIKHTSNADLAKHLRSLAAKLDADAITPGADLTIGNVRVQVAEQQESDIRAWARANADKLAAKGITVGSRGRYSQALLDEYGHYLARRRRAKAAAETRKSNAEKSEAAELIDA
jgi:hypothetical protein